MSEQTREPTIAEQTADLVQDAQEAVTRTDVDAEVAAIRQELGLDGSFDQAILGHAVGRQAYRPQAADAWDARKENPAAWAEERRLIRAELEQLFRAVPKTAASTRVAGPDGKIPSDQDLKAMSDSEFNRYRAHARAMVSGGIKTEGPGSAAPPPERKTAAELSRMSPDEFAAYKASLLG